jgi:hypothetical protein
VGAGNLLQELFGLPAAAGAGPAAQRVLLRYGIMLALYFLVMKVLLPMLRQSHAPIGPLLGPGACNSGFLEVQTQRAHGVAADSAGASNLLPLPWPVAAAVRMVLRLQDLARSAMCPALKHACEERWISAVSCEYLFMDVAVQL